MRIEILKFLAVRGLCSSTLGTEMKFFEVEDKFRLPKSSISSALCRMCNEQLSYFCDMLKKSNYLMLCQVMLKLMTVELIS